MKKKLHSQVYKQSIYFWKIKWKSKVISAAKAMSKQVGREV